MGTEGRILVTGASGFVGRHVTRALLDAGLEVVALDSAPPCNLPPGVTGVQASLLDPPSLSGLSRNWRGVIHLAAISVPDQFTNPIPVLANVQMTMNLLEHLDSARVVLVSSCHFYAPSGALRREEDPLVPHGRYGLSKHLCEQLAPHYRTRLDIRIARPFNHIGPGMPPGLMIPSLVRRIRERKGRDDGPLVMKGQNSVRDFIDVRDVASAYLALLELEGPVPDLFNVCTGKATTVRDLAEEALRQAGREGPVEFQAQPKSPDDIPFLVGSPERLDRACGWRAKYSLADSLSNLLINSPV